ncbi:hypothetical protein NTD86_05770 [Pseudomonas sp. 7P_10.2_Bac1]|nr:hypothetical protein [Pseudomonas sp. 7P_10.2_Bac1]MCU1726493.1 hypothetical protein [Pseudomonas sp. 7P_10.2_Bac1]
MNYQTPTLRRALAGDYAIGLMPPAACKRFEQLLVNDAGLREELAAWQTSLARLTDSLSQDPVPDRVWQGIVARIEPQVAPKRPFLSGLNLVAIACVVVVAVVVLAVF